MLTDLASNTILLVEDSDLDAGLVRASIEDICTAVHRVTSLSAAKSAIASLNPTVVVLDLTLDDSEGEETMLRGLEAANATPVVVMTGSGDARFGQRALELGADAFCQKSADMKHIAHTIRFTLERAGRLRAAFTAERNLQGILDGIGDGALVVSSEDRVVYLNRVAATVLGACGDMRGQHPPSDMPRRAGRFLVGVSQQPVQVSVTDVVWGEEACTLYTLRDLGNWEKLQALRSHLAHTERLRALGTLSAGVAHEINNPGQSVYTNLFVASEICRDIVENSPKASEMSEFTNSLVEILDDCQTGMRQIFGVVGRMNRFSRTDATTLEDVSLAQVTDEALKLMRHQFRPDIDLTADIQPTPTLKGDSVGLTQVITNLVTNAIEAMEPNGQDYTLNIACGVTPNSEVFIRVTDSGPGVPHRLISRIADPFFTTKRNARGTGLGLALCSEILERHGGKLHIDSVPGEGATFEARIPHATNAALRLVQQAPG